MPRAPREWWTRRGPEPAPHAPRRLLADSSGTTEQQQRRLVDTSVVVAPDRGWSWTRHPELFLDVATAVAGKHGGGHVDVPSGQLILQLRCWTEQEVAAYAAAADAAAADAQMPARPSTAGAAPASG